MKSFALLLVPQYLAPRNVWIWCLRVPGSAGKQVRIRESCEQALLRKKDCGEWIGEVLTVETVCVRACVRVYVFLYWIC